MKIGLKNKKGERKSIKINSDYDNDYFELNELLSKAESVLQHLKETEEEQPIAEIMQMSQIIQSNLSFLRFEKLLWEIKKISTEERSIHRVNKESLKNLRWIKGTFDALKKGVKLSIID